MKPWEKNWSATVTEDAAPPWEKNWSATAGEPLPVPEIAPDTVSLRDRIGGAVSRFEKFSGNAVAKATQFVDEAILGNEPEFKSVLETSPIPARDTATTSRVPLRPEVRKEFNAAFDAATPVERQKASDQKGWRGQVARERTDKWAASDAAVPTKTVRELDTRKEYQFLTPTEGELKPKIARMQLEEVAEQSRSAMDYGKDFYNALGQGIVTVPKLAVDLVAPDSALAGRLRTELASMRDQESETIKARDALMQMSIKEKEGFVDKYVETASQLLGNPSLGIRELVRQLPMMAGIAAASALGGGLAVGAVGVAGRLSPAVALSNALTSGGITAAAKAAGATAGGIGGSMTMAGGDAAGSTYEHYMDDKAMTQAMLDKSPDYQDLMRSGLSPQDARRELAVTKSRMAALMAAPLGLLGFMGAEAAIVSRVVRGAPKKFGAKEAAGLALRDSIGEQLEEGGTQAASNFAIQTVDENRSLMEGVPQAMATAAVTSAPMSVGAAALNMTGRQTPAPPPIDPTPDAGQMMRDLGLLGGPGVQPTPAEQAAQADIENLRTSLQREPTPDEVTDAAAQRAMNNIGSAGNVGEAIGAAQAAVRTSTRAVTLDDAALLAGGLDQAGIAAEELTQRAMPQGVDSAIAEAGEQVGQTVAPTKAAGPAGLSPETTTWTGRRGDGYATIEDATRAMTERSKTRPAFAWTAQQNADGRFVLQGVKQGAASQDSVQSALQPPKESVRELRDQANRVGALQDAVAREGEDASTIQLYAGRAEEELGVERGGRPGAIQEVAQVVADIGRVSQVAFGWKPIPIVGLADSFGVQHKGSVFINVEALAAGNAYGAPADVMTIQTIGHETTHQLEKSQDPQDQADYATLRNAILSNAKDGVVDRRVASEKKTQTYGENEVVADVSGSFWLDSKFWSRLYDLDSAAMRRIAYKFMEGATKLIEVVKGSRLDAGRYIKNVDAVREVAAQVWASKAKRGDSLFAPSTTDTPSRSDARSNFEVAPDPNDTVLSGKWNGLELTRKIEISREVAQDIVPQVLALSGAKGSIADQTGSYLADTNPSFALKLTQGDLTEVSKQLGYVLSQDSMMNLSLKPFPGSSVVGAVFVDVGSLGFDGIESLYNELRTAVPEVGGQSTTDGVMTILNYSNLDTQALTSKVDQVVGSRYDVRSGEVSSSFPEKKDYDYDNQTNDAGVSDSPGEVVRQRLGGLRREASAAINRAIDQPARSTVGAERDARGSRPEGGRTAAGPNAPSKRATDGRLEGAPSVPGFSGPDPRIVSVAEQYARDNGIALKPQAAYAKIDPARAKRIADAYDQMANAPQDPAVKAAYQNLIDQTVAQYRALENAGYKFWFIDINTQAGQDYVSTPWNAMRDMRANQSMGVFPSEEGFGSSDLDVSSNPLLAETGVMWPAGSPDGPMQRVLANDLFRAVHDAFGHGMEGAGFRAEGEENAWQAHVRLFTGSAVAAITSETRGQNSFVNFGPNAEANQTASAEDTVFADQKVGLMPEWTWTEGRVGDEVTSTSTTKDDNEQAATGSTGSTKGQDGVRDGRGRSNENSRSRGGDVAGADVQSSGREGGSGGYGKAIPGAISVTGFHYSKQARQSLNSAFYGTGLKGLEAKRLEGQPDITPRIYLYVDKGNGIRPEAGVGGVAHQVTLNNIYDTANDPLGLIQGVRGVPGDRANNWERAIMQAGFDGYLNNDPVMSQGFVVLVGKKHGAVSVSPATPRIGSGQAVAAPKPKAKTRVEGNELVRRPEGSEAMQIIAAMRAGIAQVAPSFKMEFGEARVLASEQAIADTVLADHPGGFAFGEVASRSDAFAEFDDIPDDAFTGMEIEESYLDDPQDGLDDIESLADILRAELAKDQAQAPNEPNLIGSEPTPQAIKDAGIHPEDAFDMTGALELARDGSAEFFVPYYAQSAGRSVSVRGDSGELLVSVRDRAGSTFVNKPGLTDAQAEKHASRQLAGAMLTAQGHDIAAAYRKGMILKIAAAWKQVASKAGVFKLPAAKTKSTDFATIAKEMGAFKDYDVDASVTRGAGFIFFSRKSDGKRFDASVKNRLEGMEVCTMGLANSGGLGTELYAVLGRVAENMGVAFNADDMLSGVNAYRRTEQAMSYALKSGRTDVLLPGAQNRVYGFDKDASTPEAHDRNIARLALAGLRNVEELMPDVRRLKYLPQSDLFVDAKGVDAEAAVTKALADPQARVFGLGRSTIARAVITGQIIAGESIDADYFQSPIAYSLANAEMDSPMGEAWGDANDLNPNLERFIAGSQIVDKDGKPKMMFHGTAQDIKAFRPKQAGAVFLTDDPDFAGDFAERSETWMRTNWQEALTPEQQEQAKAAAIKSVMSDEYMTTTKRQQVKQGINEGNFKDPDVAYRMDMEVASMIPSGANILPVFARVTSPFDYENKADVDSVVFTLWDKSGMDDGDTLEITPVKVGAGSDFYSQRKLHDLISEGNWDIIESPEVQAIIKDTLGHDGFWVKESGQRNLAVYDPKMVKSVFNKTYDTSTDDISRSLVGAELAPFTTRDIMEQADGPSRTDLGLKAGTGTKQANKVREIAIALNKRTLDKYGAMDRTALTPRNASQIAGSIADEVQYQLGTTSLTGTGTGWYSNNYPRALTKLARRFPELREHAHARSVFTALVAVTSNGERVAKNIDNAITLYAEFRAGKPLVAMGNRRASALENNLLHIQNLIDKYGDGFRAEMLKEITVAEMNRELRAMGEEADGSYLADTIVPKAAIHFGPKLGAFYANLSGSEGYLTMDLWWTRSMNRMRGLLIPKATDASINKFREMMGTPNASRDEVAQATISIRNKYEEFGFSTELEHLMKGKEPVFKEAKPEWFARAKRRAGPAHEQLLFDHNVEKMANTIYKNEFEMLEEAPFSASDRAFMYDTARQAKTLLKDRGIELTLADIQAALWYYEKRLYQKLSGRKSDDIGYEEAINASAAQGDKSERPSVVFTGESDRGPVTAGEVQEVDGADGQDRQSEDISRSRVGNQFTLEDETYVQKKRRKLQDYFLRVQTVQRAVMGQGGTVTEQTDTYGAEVLSHGRKNALLQDFARDTVAPLMKKLVKQGVEMDELSLYAYAKHAEERNKRIASIDSRTPDGGSGMKTADANTILAAVAASGNQAKYDDLHSDLMAIVQANRLVMLDEGLITQDEFDALDGMYQNYIPLRGFEVVDEENKPTGRSAGQGFNVRGRETVRALGRKTRAGQLMENVFGDYQRTTVRSEHNHVAKVFLNFVLQNPDTKLWEIDATTTRKALDRQTGRIARNTAIEKGEDTIAVKVKGREIYIQIKDPLLARAMRKSHTDETGELARDMMRSVGLYTTLLRNTLTRYNPEFAAVNMIRDIGFGQAAMLDVLGERGVAKFTAHYPGAVLVSARNEHNTLNPAARAWDKWFTEYRAAGGITGGFYQKNVEDITEDIRGLMLEAGATPKNMTERLRHNTVTRMVAKAGRILEYAGSVSENAARVSAYRTAREMGKTPSQAAIIAKNLTTNFDRKGEYGQMLNSLYVFFNAAVQGTHRTVQLFKNPKVLGYLGAVTAGTVGLALANALAGGDDPDDGMAYWDKIPPFVKERNIIIMLPPDSQIEGAETVGTKGRYFMIPVQYGLNIFPVIGYGIADYIRNQQDASRGATAGQVGIRYASAFLGSFNPFGGAVDVTSGSSMAQAVMPSIFDPVVQFTTGTNAFGRDSAPFKSPFDAKPDSQNSNVRQSGGPAERVAQWMNEATGGSDYESGAIDVSAGTLENVVRSLTGGTGIFLYDALALADKSLESAAGGDPDLFVRDIPVYRRIMGETAGDIDQGLFYERRKQIQEARSVEKGANEAGVDITDPKKLALASMNTDAGKYTKWLAEIRREMKDVQTDTEMTKGDRKLKLRELRAERDRLTADFNRDFTDVMREELNID